jgi:hypothetical protein
VDRSVSVTQERSVQPMFDDNGHFVVAMFEIAVLIALLMCLWWIVGDLFRSSDIGGGMKALWVLFIIVLPIVGVVVYLVARGDGMTAREVSYYKAKGLPPA